jgi:threonine dehydrogenase-like Zn-dependent dehydrogenase
VRTKGAVKVGETVVIIGAGAQGLATTIAAATSGANPIIICGLEKDRLRLEFALGLGAHYIINVEEADLREAVREITSGDMADVVVECSGSPHAQAKALDLLKPLGRLVMVGISGGQQTPFLVDVLVRRELQIIGGHGQSWDVEPAIKLIDTGRLPIDKMITHIFSLTRVQEAIELARSAPPEYIRVALQP